MLAVRAQSLSHLLKMVLPLFPLPDADELACMPELHSALPTLPELEVDPGAEGAPVALPAGLETEMPTAGKDLHGNRKKDHAAYENSSTQVTNSLPTHLPLPALLASTSLASPDSARFAQVVEG